ncbi:methyl-accepting chemotaxis protein [Ferrimonas futtsuensis]|uniref:methyl-accepting chemotaxis protein n=1 Tax=Ferrimonas futtsuensis TaxID=364764 RepID=UPI000488F792|nr:methyl-accepting chemotaxis protein [Ferrimonas futtsuensis]
MKFKTKIVFASCIILLVALSALSVNQYLTTKRSIVALTESSVTEIANGIAQSVQNNMAFKMDVGRYMMSLIEEDPSEQNINSVFTKPVVKSQFVLAGVGFESDGRLVDNDVNWHPSADYDSRQRPWYIDAKRQDRVILTPPYPDSVTGEILVSLGVPMKENGLWKGAMFLDVSLKELDQAVNSVNLFDAGYAFLLTKDHKFITHPDVSLHGKPVSELFGNALHFGGAAQEVSVQGADQYIRFFPLPETGWLLGVALDSDKMHATETALRNDAVLYSLLALALAIGALTLLLSKLMAPLGTLNEAMEDIASGEGDLTRTMDTNTDAEFASLAGSFNGFSSKLREMISQVKLIAESISDGTRMTADGSRRSGEAMSKQLEELEALATAMNEMASTSMEVARNAQGAAAAVQEADNSVEAGVQTVANTADAIEQLSAQIDQAVAVVEEVSESTRNIESILAVINDIADQTNLLALNAAIEAARAGEQGRGFAVVADEVRTLASRTQQSTSEIRAMIDQLAAGSRNAVAVMGESKAVAGQTVETSASSSAALTQIRAAIKQITDMNMQIASAAEEQSLVAEDINKSTLNIKELSQQVAEAADDASQAMGEQLQLVDKQDGLLNQFKV